MLRRRHDEQGAHLPEAVAARHARLRGDGLCARALLIRGLVDPRGERVDARAVVDQHRRVGRDETGLRRVQRVREPRLRADLRALRLRPVVGLHAQDAERGVALALALLALNVEQLDRRRDAPAQHRGRAELARLHRRHPPQHRHRHAAERVRHVARVVLDGVLLIALDQRDPPPGRARPQGVRLALDLLAREQVALVRLRSQLERHDLAARVDLPVGHLARVEPSARRARVGRRPVALGAVDERHRPPVPKRRVRALRHPRVNLPEPRVGVVPEPPHGLDARVAHRGITPELPGVAAQHRRHVVVVRARTDARAEVLCRLARELLQVRLAVAHAPQRAPAHHATGAVVVHAQVAQPREEPALPGHRVVDQPPMRDAKRPVMRGISLAQRVDEGA